MGKKEGTMILFQGGRGFAQHTYRSEDDFEKDIVDSSKTFFGEDSIYIDSKKKIGSLALGNAIPDGFLFDMSDPSSREFYIVEAELESHLFYDHIFPQVTKVFAFFRNSKRQGELVKKLFSTLDADPTLRAQFKRYLGEQEIFKFLSGVIDSSQNILLVMDGDKPELPEIMDTYSDTWGKMVRIMTVRKFVNGDDRIFVSDPEFETIEYAYQEIGSEDESTSGVVYSEEFHLEGVNDNVKQVYYALKDSTMEMYDSHVFSPQKYYVSIRGAKNIAFIKFRKKKIRLVIMLPEDVIRARVTHHNITSLSEAVQKFYNGPCAAVDIDGVDEIGEIIDTIGVLVDQDLPVS